MTTIIVDNSADNASTLSQPLPIPISNTPLVNTPSPTTPQMPLLFPPGAYPMMSISPDLSISPELMMKRSFDENSYYQEKRLKYNTNYNTAPMYAVGPMMSQNIPMPYPVMGQNGYGGPNQGNQSRTVYVGNLPSEASVDELLSQVRFGPIESVKILPEKSCAFISFLDPATASAFQSDANMRKVRLHEQELKMGWGSATPVPSHVLQAVQQHGATRNVYIGHLEESLSEQELRDELAHFGPIDQVKIVRDKNIGFIHFLSIATAIKVVHTLQSDPEWASRRVNYGKDRCAYVPKNQQQQQQHNLAAAAMGSMAASNYTSNYMIPTDPTQIGNRTVYLGNLHPDTTTEDICNTIRGGILQVIRHIAEKHICFVTFVDPACALAFVQTAMTQGLALHNRRLKVGWGKHSGPCQPGIAMAVQAGASRNVYVGNIDDFDTYTIEKLKTDFAEFGDIELANLFREKQCAFVNFTNITYAIKAIENIKSHPDYAQLKIAYGKDRCGGPPRSFRHFNNSNNRQGPPQHHQHHHHHQQQQQHAHEEESASPAGEDIVVEESISENS